MNQKMTHKKELTRQSLRPVILLMLAITMSVTAMAEPVDLELARQKAKAFLNGRTMARGNSDAGDQQINVLVSTNGYHVFNCGTDGGFVIISGDDRTPAVLGYADRGSISEETMPDALRWLLNGFQEQIAWLDDNGSDASVATMRVAKKVSNARTAIAPLIATRLPLIQVGVP